MLGFDLELAGQRFGFLFGVREKLVKRWIERADGDRQSVHRAEDALEVFPLKLEQLGQPADVHPFRLFDLVFQFSSASSQLSSLFMRARSPRLFFDSNDLAFKFL